MITPTIPAIFSSVDASLRYLFEEKETKCSSELEKQE